MTGPRTVGDAAAPSPARRRLGAGVAVVLVALAALPFGLLAGTLANGPSPYLAMLFPLALLPVLLWWRPAAGVFIVLAATLTVEQFAYEVGPRPGAATAAIPFFSAIVPGAGVTGGEVLVVGLLAIAVFQAVRDRRRPLPATPMHRYVTALLVLALLYFGVGLSRGGDMTMALWEVRPFVYLAVTFYLARTLLGRAEAVRAVLWVVVLGTGFKAMQGLLIWWDVRDLPERPEAVLAHEESVFFGIALCAVLGMWLFGVGGRLRTVATLLAPFVLVCDMVNSRRAAWLILILGGVFMMVIAAVAVPARRRGIIATGLAGATAFAIYLPLFWNSYGTLAQPARAISSQFRPDVRDQASNQYREIENNNLKDAIRARTSTGEGFGIKIPYRGIVDLTSISRNIAYIPHNSVLYVWYRMGLLGMAAWLLVLGQAVLTAARLARVAVEPHVKMFGALVACAVTAYVGMAATDMGVSWFRIAMFTGILLGIVDGLSTRYPDALGRRHAPMEQSPVSRDLVATGGDR